MSPLVQLHLVGLVVGLVCVDAVWWRNGCPPSTNFGSFSGRTASDLDDCIWDSMACLRSNLPECCQVRFQDCCAFIMGGGSVTETEPPPPSPPPEEEVPYQHADTLIGCIWQFNHCIENRLVPEATCYARFDECKMIIMGMTQQPDQAGEGDESDQGGLPDVPQGEPDQGGLPEVPQGGLPEVPQGGLPEVPQGELPEVPQGGLPEVPQGELPEVPQGELPEVPQGGLPEVPQGGLPEVPQGVSRVVLQERPQQFLQELPQQLLQKVPQRRG